MRRSGGFKKVKPPIEARPSQSELFEIRLSVALALIADRAEPIRDFELRIQIKQIQIKQLWIKCSSGSSLGNCGDHP